MQANFKAVTKKKGILLFLREGTRGSYSLEKYWGPCNLAESCRVRGRALCIFKAVTKKKGILLFLREGNRCSYSLEKCWGPCNLAESCRESCSTRLARLIPPTPIGDLDYRCIKAKRKTHKKDLWSLSFIVYIVELLLPENSQWGDVHP